MTEILNQLRDLLGSHLPTLLGALAILALGLIVAPLIAALVRYTLHRSPIEKRIARWAFGDDVQRTAHAERWVARLFFYLILLFVLVGFFNVLNLDLVAKPLQGVLEQLFQYLPRLFGAAVLLLVAWILASLVRMLIRSRLLTGTRADKWIADVFQGREKRASLNNTLAEAAYWLVFLLFVPLLLDTLQLQGLLKPVQEMFSRVLTYLPNLVGALLILLIGWFIARVLQRVVTNLLASAGTERLSQQAGISQALGMGGLSGFTGLLVYVLIIIGTLVASLDRLGISTITEPAVNMLNAILASAPKIFVAVLLVLVSYLVARIVGAMVANLLGNAGFDRLPATLGLGKRPRRNERHLSDVARIMVIAAITLVASMQAFHLLGFHKLAELVDRFLGFSGQVLLALLIVVVGLYLANLAVRAIRASNAEHAPLLALVTRTAIIIMASVMAIRQANLASDIVNMAFGIVLGGVVVALAIAFGVGGRDLAARKLEDWVRHLK